MPEAPDRNMGRVPNLLEEANQFLWDSAEIAAATTTLTLFQTPLSSTKTKLRTNMTQAGVLPSPKMMKVKALRFVLGKAATVADAKLIMDATYLEFWVGDKIMLEGPVWMFGGGSGLSGFAATTAITTTLAQANNGSTDPRGIFTLKYTIDIGVQTPFYVNLIAPTAAGVAVTTWVTVVLEGTMWRGVA